MESVQPYVHDLQEQFRSDVIPLLAIGGVLSWISVVYVSVAILCRGWRWRFTAYAHIILLAPYYMYLMLAVVVVPGHTLLSSWMVFLIALGQGAIWLSMVPVNIEFAYDVYPRLGLPRWRKQRWNDIQFAWSWTIAGWILLIVMTWVHFQGLLGVRDSIRYVESL